VHAAGRAELAWAAYCRDEDTLRELVAPRLDPAEQLRGRSGAVTSSAVSCRSPWSRASSRRAGGRHRILVGVAVATLGWLRLQAETSTLPTALCHCICANRPSGRRSLCRRDMGKDPALERTLVLVKRTQCNAGSRAKLARLRRGLVHRRSAS
jgi:hypothetical protein